MSRKNVDLVSYLRIIRVREQEPLHMHTPVDCFNLTFSRGYRISYQLHWKKCISIFIFVSLSKLDLQKPKR